MGLGAREDRALGSGAGRREGIDPLTTDPTQHLRELASRVVAVTLERVPLVAALLAGSAGRGDADFYSDIDLLLYVDRLSREETIAEIRTAVGGTEPTRRVREASFCTDEFDLDGVRTEVSFLTVQRAETRLERLLGHIEEFDSPSQKVLSGVLEGRPLHGAEFIERMRARVGNYPEPFRRAMVERHWHFFPLWYYGDAMAARDAELWRLDMLLEGAFDLLAVLAALNRLYFTRFELKRMRALISKMELAPRELADRVESLFRLPPEEAGVELGRLVDETQPLVNTEWPDLELPLQFPPGTRRQAWSL